MKPARSMRHKQLGLIHQGAAAIGMDTADQNPDCEYRSMLWTCGRVRSAGDLDFQGRKVVLDHLKARGAFGAKRGNPEWGWVDTAAPERRKMLRMIIVLTKKLGKNKGYIDGTCMNMFGIARVELAGGHELHGLIAALKKYEGRHPEQVTA